ncbi:DMT family transporter [Marinomonas agarivorans]|nr:DMT family transporter [Marinomonas agarivorans]
MPLSHPTLRAAVLALLSTAILSFIDNFVFLIAQEAGLWQFQVFRTLFALPMLLIVAIALKKPLRVHNLAKIGVRSLLVASGLLVYFAALGVLSVPQAGAGLFSAPMWVLIFSVWVLAKRASLPQWLNVLCGFTGVLMVLQPEFSNVSLLSMLPLIAGALYGFGMLMTNQWCQQESAIALTIGVFTVIGIVSIGLLLGFSFWWPIAQEHSSFLTQGWVTPSASFIGLTFLQALGSVIAVLCISQAYRIGEPSHVSVYEYGFLIFAAIWAYLLWGTILNITAMVGVLIILGTGIVAAYLARIKLQPKQ